ncbi:MAG: complex I NDUFA9 subunit family protein [Burkholderiales bacterium]|jgi:NADH dehydrogenase
MSADLVTVFGGTGFLGRRVVEQLVAAGRRVRVASRHAEAARFPFGSDRVELFNADIHDLDSVEAAVDGARSVVNAVSLWVERGDVTFRSVHVEGAQRVARSAAAAHARMLVHVSGIGVDAESASAFIQARALGEQAVTAAFPLAVLLRPSVMCGPDDAFVSSLELATRFPVVPLFGHGATRLQPVHVGDVAKAVAMLSTGPDDGPTAYELGGAQVLTYRQAVECVMRQLSRRRALLPIPFAVWKLGAAALSLLPNPPLTGDQIELLEKDNVVAPGASGFGMLGLKPRRFDEAVADLLG